MSEPVITIENLSKRYVIGHELSGVARQYFYSWWRPGTCAYHDELPGRTAAGPISDTTSLRNLKQCNVKRVTKGIARLHDRSSR
jgi:hypothetical protein